MNVTPSPCNQDCVLDSRTGLCIGCGRTGDEIGRWMGMGDPERQALLARLPARLAALRETSTREPVS